MVIHISAYISDSFRLDNSCSYISHIYIQVSIYVAPAFKASAVLKDSIQKRKKYLISWEE